MTAAVPEGRSIPTERRQELFNRLNEILQTDRLAEIAAEACSHQAFTISNHGWSRDRYLGKKRQVHIADHRVRRLL